MGFHVKYSSILHGETGLMQGQEEEVGRYRLSETWHCSKRGIGMAESDRVSVVPVSFCVQVGLSKAFVLPKATCERGKD